jgi:Fis family transcriptional regulator
MSSIAESVRRNMHDYFKHLDGTPPAGVYDMMIRAVEKPLLEVVMAQAGHNQSKAADWLGLNRNTLRKKLAEHGLLKSSAP